jgi:hypothetical protein
MIDNFIKKASANTDNMGKLFVMVFANPAPMTNPAATCTRTRANVRNFNPKHLDNFLSSVSFVPRHCASALINISVP